MILIATIVALLALTACGADATGDSLAYDTQGAELKEKPIAPFDVSFGGCSEFAGIALVSPDAVRGSVPGHYDLYLVPGPDAQALLVVRVAACEQVAVGKHKANRGIVAQVGVSLAGLDETSSINNYTLWYVTNDKKLQKALSKVGVDAVYSEELQYAFTPQANGLGPLHIESSGNSTPTYAVTGHVISAPGAAVPFVASWWSDGPDGTVQMRTTLPAIQFGQTNSSLQTGPQSALAALLGGDSGQFDYLNSYNVFDAAHMVVAGVND